MRKQPAKEMGAGAGNAVPACRLPTQGGVILIRTPQAAATTGIRAGTAGSRQTHTHTLFLARARPPELTEVFAQDLQRLLQELLHRVAFLHLHEGGQEPAAGTPRRWAGEMVMGSREGLEAPARVPRALATPRVAGSSSLLRPGPPT